MTQGQVTIHENNSTDHPYTLKRGSHIANFSVLTPEQKKYVKPVDPLTTWHLLKDIPENAASCAISLIKCTKSKDFYENYWFPTPENPGEPQRHTPIQQQTIEELQNLQELEKVNPQDDPESRQCFLSNFGWKDSMLQPDETARIEDLLVKILRHLRTTGMNEEFKVKLTSKDASPPLAIVFQHQSASKRTY